MRPGAGHLQIAVSKASVPRALRDPQALLAAFDRRSFACSSYGEERDVCDGLGRGVSDCIGRAIEQATVKHTEGTGVDLEPSGWLMLKIGSSYHAGVSDSTTRRIEDSLNRFVVNLVRRALEQNASGRSMPNGRSIVLFSTIRTVSRNSNETVKRYCDGACGRPLSDGPGTSACGFREGVQMPPTRRRREF